MAEASSRNALKFIVPSILGALFFLLPVPSATTVTVPLAIVVDTLKASFSDWLPLAAIIVILSGCAVTLIATMLPRLGEGRLPARWSRLLRPGPVWVVIRLIGAVIAVAAYFKLGPAVLSGPAVGNVLLNDLAPVLLVLFLIAGFLIPLLTDYGLMEFIGVLAAPVFRFCFRIPGRGAIDAMASWMGSSTVGTLITIEQYEAGRYTGREAATIACNFSLASIAFSYVLASTVKMQAHFPAIYGTTALCAIACAIILCRIPPLTLIPDTRKPGAPAPTDESLKPSLGTAFNAAKARAATGPGPKGFIGQGFYAVASIYIGLIPSVFAIGGIGLLIVEVTPVFDVLAAPLVPFLKLLGLPDAAAAAPAFIVGLADQFLTVIVGAGVGSEQTRFVIATASIAQVLYFSELGALLMQSPIPIGFLHLVGVFILRTLITLLIASAISHLIF